MRVVDNMESLIASNLEKGDKDSIEKAELYKKIKSEPWITKSIIHEILDYQEQLDAELERFTAKYKTNIALLLGNLRII